MDIYSTVNFRYVKVGSMERVKLMKYTLPFCYDCGRRRAEDTCSICGRGMCLDCVDWVDEVGGMVCKECYLDMLLKEGGQGEN